MPIGLAARVVVVAAAVCGGLMATAPGAVADPAVTPAVADPVAAVPDGRVASPPPRMTTSPDGWTLTLAASNETQVANAPLTTALSSREYVVGGTFTGALAGPAEDGEPHGVIEVGYQIGCGIDMSTSNGVTLTGTVGASPSLGLAGIDVASPDLNGVVPVLTTPVTGGVAVGLKPGIINVVPVTKKDFVGAAPWIMIDNFHVKIDGCVGQSFIRSYAFLTRSTRMSDVILAYYGETTVV